MKGEKETEREKGEKNVNKITLKVENMSRARKQNRFFHKVISIPVDVLLLFVVAFVVYCNGVKKFLSSLFFSSLTHTLHISYCVSSHYRWVALTTCRAISLLSLSFRFIRTFSRIFFFFFHALAPYLSVSFFDKSKESVAIPLAWVCVCLCYRCSS